MSTIDLLEACRAYYKRLHSAEKNNFRFLHISTDEVLGSVSATDPAFTEESYICPNSRYAPSQASGDQYCQSLSGNLCFACAKSKLLQ